MVRILYFAAARELAGCDQEDVALLEPRLDEDGFKRWLGSRHPRLAPYLARMQLALNGELRPIALAIKDGDEICVLPPVAGGSVLAEVREGALSIDEVVNAVRDRSAGGIAIFLGVVRDHADGKAVARLDYESHVTLANREMAQILEQLMQEHPGTRVAALHRVGELEVGDTAVVVAASAAHRGEAFDVCRLAIDRIKASVPVWKKEWAPDGSALWVNLG